MFDAWKQRQRKRLENRPERTVFYNIFATMMLVLAVELLMSAASILAINVTGQLDENAKDLLTMRVRNRASYVQEILRNAEDLEQLLGVQPGSASVLGLLNDTEHRVTLVLDRAVAESRWFGCHPCRNTSSLRLRTEDVLEKFLPHTGHVPLVVEL